MKIIAASLLILMLAGSALADPPATQPAQGNGVPAILYEVKVVGGGLDIAYDEHYTIVELHVPSVDLCLNNGIPGLESFNLFRPAKNRYDGAKKLRELTVSEADVQKMQRVFAAEIDLKRMLANVTAPATQPVTQPAYTGEFTSVNADSISFRVISISRGGHVVTMPVDEKTVVVLSDGTQGKLSDLKVGQTARITLDESGKQAIKIEVGKSTWEPAGSSAATQPDIAKLITDLSSDDGKTRVAATKAIFALGKDALEPLVNVGAKQISPLGPATGRRIDMVYSLLDGFKPNPVNLPRGYHAGEFKLIVEKGCTVEDVKKMGERHGFTIPQNFALNSHAFLGRGKNLAETIKAILTSEPQVITVNLSYFEIMP